MPQKEKAHTHKHTLLFQQEDGPDACTTLMFPTLLLWTGALSSYLHPSAAICDSLPLIKYSQLVPLNIHRAARLSALHQAASSECARSPPKAWKHAHSRPAWWATGGGGGDWTKRRTAQKEKNWPKEKRQIRERPEPRRRV